MVNEHGSDEKIAQKLARVAKMHFAKQRISATGPRLPKDVYKRQMLDCLVLAQILLA